MAILASVLALLIGLIYFLSDKFCLACYEKRGYFISLISGVSVSYIFLSLLPKFYSSLTNSFILLFFLAGFLCFHVINKFIYQKVPKSKVKADLLLSHEIGFIFYYFVIGIVLQNLLTLSTKDGVLFFIPIFLISGLSAHIIHRTGGMHFSYLRYVRLLHILAVFAGVWFAIFFAIPQVYYTALIGIVAGILTYIVIRDEIPVGKKGNPAYFLAGAVIYAALIVVLWYV